MTKSRIQWTNEVWNPVTGCTWASTGCDHCYARVMGTRMSGIIGNVRYGHPFSDVMCHEDRLGQPSNWKRPRMVFVNSMSDLFHDDVIGDFIIDVLVTIRKSPQHTYQILTKRPKRMLRMFSEWFGKKGSLGPVLENLWVGVTCENHEQADERIPLLLNTPAAVRWVSVEPQLEFVNLENYLVKQKTDLLPGIDWVVCGGESGQKARPFIIDWARTLRNQCRSYGVPFFMKQVGSNPWHQCYENESGIGYPERIETVHSKGGDPLEWPDDLRVREFPGAKP